jgi:uncharacterized sulfatase
MRGKDAVAAARGELEKALQDESPSVRIVAAQALGQFGGDADAKKALDVLLPLADAGRNDYFVCVEALNAIDALGPRAKPALAAIKALPTEGKVAARAKEYVPRLLERLADNLR